MNESSGPTPLETLKASTEVTVSNLAGDTETITLRQIALGDCDKLLAAQDNEVVLACLYTGRDRAWFEGLVPESQEQVVVQGDRLNADFFGRWFRRRLERQERLMPGVTEKFVQRALEPEPAQAPPRSLNSAPPLVRSRG